MLDLRRSDIDKPHSCIRVSRVYFYPAGVCFVTSSPVGFPHVYIFRSAYIYPVEPRKEFNFSYRLLRTVYPVFRVLFPNQAIRADDLGRAMVDLAICKTGESRTLILENRDISAMIKSHNVPPYPHASA